MDGPYSIRHIRENIPELTAVGLVCIELVVPEKQMLMCTFLPGVCKAAV